MASYIGYGVEQPYGNNQMAETTKNGTTETDIFQQQKKTIDTLINVLEQQGAQPPQIVYAQQPQTAEQQPKNYILYIGLGILAFLILRKGKI